MTKQELETDINKRIETIKNNISKENKQTSKIEIKRLEKLLANLMFGDTPEEILERL